MEPNENLLAADLQVDDIAIGHLRETSRWAKFLAMVGMIISVLIALFGVFAGVIFNSLISKYNSGSGPILGTGFISVFYIVIAGIFFVTSLFLYFFGTKMRNALQTTDQELFNESLLNLKRYYRIVGVITIVYLGFLVLVLLLAIFAASFSKIGR